MNPETRVLLDKAVSAEHPVEELVSLAASMRDKGIGKQEVYDLFLGYMLNLRAQNRAREEDAVCDALDYVSGWCEPDRRIFLD